MLDSFNREINYLRISITDRCNLRCRYCMPESGIDLIRHQDVLSYEEILEIVSYAVDKGVDKVRITGGEPLIRKGVVDFVRNLAKIKGIKDLSMTTNAVLLGEYAKDLKKAGLHRVNVSLDTLDAEKYHYITRFGTIENVFLGLEAAKEAGLLPIKINTVVDKQTTLEEKEKMRQFARKNDYEVRFIKEMNLECGQFAVVEGGTGGDCPRCNRLRLTADGKLKPCLFSNLSYDVRQLGVEQAFSQALVDKPKSGKQNTVGYFYNMGG